MTAAGTDIREFRSRLDVRRLIVLREIARRGTLSAAADALNFSPSAVSQQLRLLEREVGTPLVERGADRASLTYAGRVLVQHADNIVARLDEAEQDVRAVAGIGHGRLRLGTFRSAGESLLVEAITYFRGHHPGIRVSLLEDEPEHLMRALRKYDLDLILTYDYDYLDLAFHEGVARTLVCTDPILVAVPPDLVPGATSVRLSDLKEHTWIASTPRNAVYQFTERACAEVGFKPKIAMHTDDYHIAQELVAGGVGCTFLPAMAAEHSHPGVRVLPVADLPLSRRIYATYRSGGDTVMAVGAVRDVLVRVANEE